MDSIMSIGTFTNAAHCWILDYYCHCTLEEWIENFQPRSNKYMRAGNFLGDFSGDLVVSKDLQFKLELISWLPQLHKLHSQQNSSAFTEILEEIDSTSYICPESFNNETLDFLNQLKIQCLLLCCQKLGFSKAIEIYEDLKNNQKFDEESNKELSEILNSKDSEHEELQCNIQNQIKTIVSEYLQKYVTLNTPFLLKAAKESLKDDETFEIPKSTKNGDKCIAADLMGKLTSKYKEDSDWTFSDFDEFEKEIYLNKLKNLWHKTQKNYHEKLQKFEKNLFLHSKDKESTTDTPSSDRAKKRPRKFSVSPVEKTFPEIKTIRLKNSLRPPSMKKHTQGLRVAWTSEEEEEFYLAVKRYGVGNWAKICECISFHKTNVNLKDKWRSFHQSGRIKMLIDQFGKV